MKLKQWAAVAPMALALMILLFPLTAGLTGCSPGQAENEVNTIILQLTNIMAVAEPGASWVKDAANALNILKVAEANWIKGAAVQDVINALNTAELVIAVIPVTAPYSGLADVLVAGIEAVLALLLPPPAGALTGVQQQAREAASLPVGAASPNPHKWRASVSSAKDSKTQWNLLVSADPRLAAAKIP